MNEELRMLDFPGIPGGTAGGRHAPARPGPRSTVQCAGLPVPPLARPVFRLTDPERRATSLARFARRMVPVPALARLRQVGWQLARPVDGLHDHLYRPVGKDLRVLLQLDDGLPTDAPWAEDERVVEAVELSSAPPAPWWSRCGDTPFGVLDPLTASEVLRELTDALG